MTGTRLTIISQILPSFFLAVGVGYSVHLFVIFYRHLRDQGNKREAIGYALGHSGFAILITSLTTAGGLLSFTPVKVAPVSDLGIFRATGVLICVSFTLILGESWNKGTTARISLDYDWFDAFNVGGGWLVYQKGRDSEYSSSTSLAFAKQISQNDRIFLETAYSF